MFLNFAAHTMKFYLQIFLKMCAIWVMNNIKAFHHKINYLLLCIKYSAEFHMLAHSITINSSSQVRILNHLHLLPCP